MNHCPGASPLRSGGGCDVYPIILIIQISLSVRLDSLQTNGFTNEGHSLRNSDPLNRIEDSNPLMVPRISVSLSLASSTAQDASRAFVALHACSALEAHTNMDELSR